MKELREYLNNLSADEQASFAKNCKTSIGFLRKALSAGQRLNAATCVLIWKNSDGLVSRQSLREDWADIWPELADADRSPGRRKNDFVSGRRIVSSSK